MHYHYDYPFNPTTPEVIISTIEVVSPSDIVVTFDIAPITPEDIIRYTIDGGDKIEPLSIGIIGSVMTITASTPFLAGQVVKWYDFVTTHDVVNNLV